MRTRISDESLSAFCKRYWWLSIPLICTLYELLILDNKTLFSIDYLITAILLMIVFLYYEKRRMKARTAIWKLKTRRRK